MADPRWPIVTHAFTLLVLLSVLDFHCVEGTDLTYSYAVTDNIGDCARTCLNSSCLLIFWKEQGLPGASLDENCGPQPVSLDLTKIIKGLDNLNDPAVKYYLNVERNQTSSIVPDCETFVYIKTDSSLSFSTPASFEHGLCSIVLITDENSSLVVSSNLMCDFNCSCLDSLKFHNSLKSHSHNNNQLRMSVTACLFAHGNASASGMVVTSGPGAYLVLELTRTMTSLASFDVTVQSLPDSATVPAFYELVKYDSSKLDGVQCFGPRGYVPSCSGDTTTASPPTLNLSSSANNLPSGTTVRVDSTTEDPVPSTTSVNIGITLESTDITTPGYPGGQGSNSTTKYNNTTKNNNDISSDISTTPTSNIPGSSTTPTTTTTSTTPTTTPTTTNTNNLDITTTPTTANTNNLDITTTPTTKNTNNLDSTTAPTTTNTNNLDSTTTPTTTTTSITATTATPTTSNIINNSDINKTIDDGNGTSTTTTTTTSSNNNNNETIDSSTDNVTTTNTNNNNNNINSNDTSTTTTVNITAIPTTATNINNNNNKTVDNNNKTNNNNDNNNNNNLDDTIDNGKANTSNDSKTIDNSNDTNYNKTIKNNNNKNNNKNNNNNTFTTVAKKVPGGKSSSLSPGILVAIVLACILALVLVGLLGYLALRRQKMRKVQPGFHGGSEHVMVSHPPAATSVQGSQRGTTGI